MTLPNDYKRIDLLAQNQIQVKVNRFALSQKQSNKKLAEKVVKSF